MNWHDWSDEAFASARERDVPVFLFLRASWCRFCRELESQVLEHPSILSRLEEGFVALRVDKDRRPDIDARYSKGGWPTLAYLDDSGELIASDSYLDVPELAQRLELIAGYYAENRDSIRRRLSEVAAARAESESTRRRPHLAGELSREPLDWTTAKILESADPIFGGWGQRHKFPHPEALDLALIRWSQTGDDAYRKLVLRTLRHMQDGEIHDRVEGGFYRYATAPDWSGPHHEKMLDSNAQRLFVYLEAWQAFGDERFRRTAEGILDWMESTLLDERTGCYRGSQDADAAYAHLGTLAARRAHGAPECDPTVFANWNALAVSALVKASVTLDEERWQERAFGILEFLLEELFDPRQGVYHYWDGAVHLPGLLTDQAHVLRALIDTVQYTGESRFLRPAGALAELVIETMRHPDGGFDDRRHDPSARGVLRRRARPLSENAVLAEALLRLSFHTRRAEFADIARTTLIAFGDGYRQHGHAAAGYARAIDLFFHPPVHVTIVGRIDSPQTHALRRAALEPYFASRIVQLLDPVRDSERLDRTGLFASTVGARAYVHRGRESYAETSDPARLAPLMARIEGSRRPAGAPPAADRGDRQA